MILTALRYLPESVFLIINITKRKVTKTTLVGGIHMNFGKVDQLVENIVHNYGIPCCDLSIYYKHQEVFRRREGFVNLEGTKPAGEDDLYFLCSCSKMALTTAAMQLVEKGLISLSDPVSKYLPEFGEMKVQQGDKLVPCEREATIEDLLSMRAGLNYKNLAPGERPDMEEMARKQPEAGTREFIRQFLKTPLEFQPGTRFLYSMCHDVMGAVIEVVTGMRYRDYIAENITKPLGMKTLEYHLRPEDRERVVQHYTCNINAQNQIHSPLLFPMNKDVVATMGTFGPNYDSAGGGVISTVSDYVLLADALANGGVGANGARILSRASIDDMRTNRLTTQQMFDDHALRMQDYGYGYGLGGRTLMDPRAAKSPVGEYGWDGWAGAYFLADVENNVAIFFAMSVGMMLNVKALVHNKLRDYTYEALADELGNA